MPNAASLHVRSFCRSAFAAASAPFPAPPGSGGLPDGASSTAAFPANPGVAPAARMGVVSFMNVPPCPGHPGAFFLSGRAVDNGDRDIGGCEMTLGIPVSISKPGRSDVGSMEPDLIHDGESRPALCPGHSLPFRTHDQIGKGTPVESLSGRSWLVFAR